MIREILKMGDERLLRIAQPVPSELLGSEELQRLIDDMFETMHHVGGVGLAAPQIGVDLQLVIFGFERSERYPDAPAVPPTILLNPRITRWTTRWKRAGRAACRCRVARRGIAPSAHPLPGPGPAGTADRPQRRRVPCAGGAARVRPPDRPPVSLANHRLQQVRLHRGAVPRPGPRRGRLSGCACGSAPAWLSSAMGCRAAPPERVFARFARRFSWAVFSGFLRVSFFAFSPLLMAFTSPRSTCVARRMADGVRDAGRRRTLPA